MGYFEDTVPAQEFFSKVVRNVAFNNYWNNVQKDFNKEFEDKKVQKNDKILLDSQLKESRETLDNIITNKSDMYADPYVATQFLYYVARIDCLEKLQNINIEKAREIEEKNKKASEAQEKRQKEINCIKELFDSFDTRKTVYNTKSKDIERVPKTSEELMEERNRRLATLNYMFSKRRINEDDFTRGVVALRRRYAEVIDSRSKVEEQEIEKQKKNPISKVVDKVKSKIKKDEKATEQDYRKEYLAEGATKALINANNILREEDSKIKKEEADECLREGFRTHLPLIVISKDSQEMIDKMFDAKIEKAKKTARDDVDLKFNIEKTRKEKIAFTSMYNYNDRLITPGEISDRDVQFMNYMCANYKHTKTSTFSERGIEMEITFEDKNIQSIYDEMMATFRKMRTIQVKWQNHENEIIKDSEKVIDNLQELYA